MFLASKLLLPKVSRRMLSELEGINMAAITGDNVP
jgi:hypothetical protein